MIHICFSLCFIFIVSCASYLSSAPFCADMCCGNVQCAGRGLGSAGREKGTGQNLWEGIGQLMIINKMQFNVILFRNVDSLVSTLSGRKIAVSGGFITSSTPGRIITWRCYRNIPSVFKTSCSIWFFSTWSEQAWSHLQTKQYSFRFWRVLKSVLVI